MSNSISESIPSPRTTLSIYSANLLGHELDPSFIGPYTGRRVSSAEMEEGYGYTLEKNTGQYAEWKLGYCATKNTHVDHWGAIIPTADQHFC